MARLMARQLAALGDIDAVLLVPVPLHRWRLWSRGFNQAALLADELARLTGAPRDHHLLLRVKPTASLRGKGRKERERIVARSEEHTSELQSLMRISYAVFCLKKKNKSKHQTHINKQSH